MLSKPRLAFATILIALLTFAPAAFAQRVLLVEPSRDDRTLFEAFNRLRAELLLQDFEVSVLAAGEGVTPATLEDEAQRSGAFAGILLARSERGATADVWIADRVTGKVVKRRLTISGAAQAPRVVAVRAVDLLRASLRELPSGERPPPDVVGVQSEPVAPSVRAWSEPSSSQSSHSAHSFRLRASAIALGTASELNPAFGASIGLQYRAAPWLAAGLFAAGPLVGARYETAVGSARAREMLALATLTANLSRDDRFEIGPILGAGVFHLQAHGEVDPPLRSQSNGVFCFAGNAGIEAALRLTPTLLLSTSLSALLLAPRPVIAVDTEQVPVKAPLLMASVGVGVGF